MITEQQTHPLIAKEGWGHLIIGVVLTLVLQPWFPFLSFLSLVYTLFALQFFRDPIRTVPAQSTENSLLSAADGKVIRIERGVDPYTEREAIKISVFMNVFNVHSNRVPVDGEVQDIQYFPGQFLNAALDKASTDNERNAVVVKTAKGHVVTYCQVAGLVARRILCYAKKGDQLKRGQRYGFIRFGSRVDHYIPLDSTVHVNLGDKVSATTTILATFPEAASAPVVEDVTDVTVS